MALDYKLIGERLKKARIKKGYTQQKLAEIIDVSDVYLSRIENGTTHLSLKRLNELCIALDTTEGSILNGASYDVSSYLNSEFDSVLKDFSSEDREKLYKIATIICDKKENK